MRHILVCAGAGMIFGATGGVLEAAIRTAYKVLNGEEMPVPEFEYARGQSSLKYGEVTFGDKTITVAVAHGTGNAKKALAMFKSSEKKFEYMEVMACPGGCVGGSGQPILGGRDHKKISLDYRHNRADALYNIEKGKAIRRSHENPRIKQIHLCSQGETPLSKCGNVILNSNKQPSGCFKHGDVSFTFGLFTNYQN